MAFLLALIVVFERANAPFVSHHVAAQLEAARPLPSLESLHGLAQHDTALVNSIDVVSQASAHTTVAGHAFVTFRYTRTAPLAVDGWAIDRNARAPAGGIVASFDGKAVAQVHTGRSRPDVALAFADPAFNASGFHLEIPAASVPLGRHRLSLHIIDARYTATDRVKVILVIDTQRNGPS